MECHCERRSHSHTGRVGTRQTTAKSHRETHTNKLRACQKRPEQNRSPILEEHAKSPDSCGLLGASVQHELQRVGVGHLAPDVQFHPPTPKYPLKNFHLVSTQHIKYPGNSWIFADTKNTFPFQGTEISKYPGKIEETKSTSPFKGTKICRNKECVSL